MTWHTVIAQLFVLWQVQNWTNRWKVIRWVRCLWKHFNITGRHTSGQLRANHGPEQDSGRQSAWPDAHLWSVTGDHLILMIGHLYTDDWSPVQPAKCPSPSVRWWLYNAFPAGRISSSKTPHQAVHCPPHQRSQVAQQRLMCCVTQLLWFINNLLSKFTFSIYFTELSQTLNTNAEIQSSWRTENTRRSSLSHYYYFQNSCMT